MFPQICKIGPVTIYSYGLAIVTAFLVAANLISRRAKAEGFDPDAVYSFCFVCLLFGIIGARAFYVIENLKLYLEHPLEIVMLQRGGLSWFGGFFAGILSGLVFIKIKKLNPGRMLDLIAPYLALGQAIGRIGCFLNGCCYGSTVIPIQIISSFLLVMIFVILKILQDRPHKTGQIFLSYILLYSIKRFSVEFFRLENERILSGLSLFQMISIALFVSAVIGLFALKSRK